MNSMTRTTGRGLYWSLITFLIFGAAAALGEESAEIRSNSTSEGQGIQRGAVGDGTVSYREFAPLIESGVRDKTRKSTAPQKTRPGSSSAANVDFWFFDVDVQLFSDVDRDGYFYGIDLLFDADTNFVSAEVYAVIYLSYEGGPWNEYAETANFNIYGATSDDEYIVESELVSGYPTGDYDILIELFDTFDNSFVASIGPDDTSELSFLPLEDIGRDSPIDTQIVVSRGGGGALGLVTLVLLLGATAFTRRQRRHH